MKNITLTSDVDLGYTPVSHSFINKYMPSANGEFVKVYLYLLHCLDTGKSISVSDIADFFEKEEADVFRAFRYWEKQGLLSVSSHASGENVSIKILSPDTKDTVADRSEKKTSFQDTSALPCDDLHESESFSHLVLATEVYFKRSLRHTDTDILLYMHDDLGIPLDLIEFLICQAVSKGKNNLKYVEAMARTLLDSDVRTLKAAKEYYKNNSDTTRMVAKAFGIQKRNLGSSEQDFIFKWTDTFGFDTDIIVEACNRTLKTTHEPSFSYADGILSKWHEKGVVSFEDIKRTDEEHAKTVKTPGNKKSSSKTSKAGTASKNTFNNFEQRNLDFDTIAKNAFLAAKSEE